MITFLIFCLATIGLTHIMVDGKIFLPVRDFFQTLPDKLESWPFNFVWKWIASRVAEALHCYQCSGFWCGCFCGLFTFGYDPWWQLFLFGWAGSFMANLAGVFMTYLDAQSIITLDDKSKNV